MTFASSFTFCVAPTVASGFAVAACSAVAPATGFTGLSTGLGGTGFGTGTAFSGILVPPRSFTSLAFSVTLPLPASSDFSFLTTSRGLGAGLVSGEDVAGGITEIERDTEWLSASLP